MDEFFSYYDAIEETSEVIYCGKGNNGRIKSMKRNRYYNNVANKHKLVRTVIPMLDEDLALKYEDWLMEYYHTWIDDPLATKHACNIDGPNTNNGGRSCSKESAIKIGKSNTGKHSPKKGKTNIEFYGEDIAREIALKKSKSSKGIKHSKEACKKKSERQKGIKFCKEHIDKINQHKFKPCIKIDFVTNQEIERFSSIKEAYEKTGINGNYISACCQGKLKSAGSYFWKFVNDM